MPHALILELARRGHLKSTGQTHTQISGKLLAAYGLGISLWIGAGSSSQSPCTSGDLKVQNTPAFFLLTSTSFGLCI